MTLDDRRPEGGEVDPAQSTRGPWEQKGRNRCCSYLSVVAAVQAPGVKGGTRKMAASRNILSITCPEKLYSKELRARGGGGDKASVLT